MLASEDREPDSAVQAKGVIGCELGNLQYNLAIRGLVMQVRCCRHW